MSDPAPSLVTRRFVPFFATQFLSAFNDNVFKNALVLFIASTSASAFGLRTSQTIFLCHGAFVLPFFLFSATAGQIADRYDKALVVRAVKVAEVGIMGVAALGFATGNLPVLLASLAAMGVHSAFLGPVKYGIVPELVEPSSIVVANAWVEMGTFLAILAGTVLAGVMVAEGHLGAVSALVVILAGLGALASLGVPRLRPASPTIVVQWDLVRPTKDVLARVAARRPILNAVLAISWFWFVGTCFLSLFPIYARETLGSSEGVVTLMLATFCVGIALGSLLTERISGPNLELALVPIGALAMTIAMIDVYRIGAHPAPATGLRDVHAFLAEPWSRRLLADLAVVAVGGGLFTVPLYSFLAKRAPKDERARIVAGNNVLNALLMVLATGLLVALEHFGYSPPEIILVVAVLNLAVAIYVESVVPEFVLRFVVFLLSKVMYRLRVDGLRNIPDEGAAVIVCNHVSFVDWIVIGGMVRRPVRFVMDHRIAATPVARIFFERSKTIPIAPAKEDPAMMEKAFQRIAAELRDGELVCIFPEGKLTADGRMSPFRSGVDRILRETPVPVVPMALHGLWGSIFSRKDGPALSKPPRRFRARLRLSIGEPIDAEHANSRSLEERVRELLGSELA